RPILAEVVKEAPGEVLAWFWLAAASPSPEEAVPCLRRVLEMDADHAPARQALAKLLVAQAATLAAAGDRVQARACVAEATRLTPEAPGVWLAMASISEDDARIEALRRAAALAADDQQIRTRLRQALLYRANAVARVGPAQARTLFRETTDLEPRDARVWYALAQLADSPADAIDPLRELLRVAPAHEAGCAMLKARLAADARALMESGAAAEASARWREAVA